MKKNSERVTAALHLCVCVLPCSRCGVGTLIGLETEPHSWAGRRKSRSRRGFGGWSQSAGAHLGQRNNRNCVLIILVDNVFLRKKHNSLYMGIPTTCRLLLYYTTISLMIVQQLLSDEKGAWRKKKSSCNGAFLKECKLFIW